MKIKIRAVVLSLSLVSCLSVSANGYTFRNPSEVVFLTGNITNLNFTATRGLRRFQSEVAVAQIN